LAHLEVQRRRPIIRLIYWGPPGAGKTSNLRGIAARIAANQRGRLTVLHPREPAYRCEYLTLCVPVGAGDVRVRLFTAPAAARHEAVRRAMLTGADAVVFVADARREATAANQAARRSLGDGVRLCGPRERGIPVITQYNKCDLADVLSAVERRPLGPGRDGSEGAEPAVLAASATLGTGVMETLWTAVAAALHAAWERGEHDDLHLPDADSLLARLAPVTLRAPHAIRTLFAAAAGPRRAVRDTLSG
jgi:hypothetical protein